MDDAERAALRGRLRPDMEGADDGAGPDGTTATTAATTAATATPRRGRPTPRSCRPGRATRVIGISSGKGGVGKSSVTVNLAVALARPATGSASSTPTSTASPSRRCWAPTTTRWSSATWWSRPTAHGVRCLSMGFFVPDDQPVIWRGPMLHKAIEQFLTDAYWGEPDFLLVDMPPGTGDVTLSLAQVMPRAEMWWSPRPSRPPSGWPSGRPTRPAS